MSTAINIIHEVNPSILRLSPGGRRFRLSGNCKRLLDDVAQLRHPNTKDEIIMLNYSAAELNNLWKTDARWAGVTRP